MTDAQLLAAFVDERDQRAFTQLVDRYASLVYSAAVRQAGTPLAEDVVQAVFILLARKAARIRGNLLAGWLVKTTRLCALAAARNERRLKARERRAAQMRQETVEQKAEPESHLQIVGQIDELLAHLAEADRCAFMQHLWNGIRAIPSRTFQML